MLRYFAATSTAPSPALTRIYDSLKCSLVMHTGTMGLLMILAQYVDLSGAIAYACHEDDEEGEVERLLDHSSGRCATMMWVDKKGSWRVRVNLFRVRMKLERDHVEIGEGMPLSSDGGHYERLGY